MNWFEKFFYFVVVIFMQRKIILFDKQNCSLRFFFFIYWFENLYLDDCMEWFIYLNKVNFKIVLEMY